MTLNLTMLHKMLILVVYLIAGIQDLLWREISDLTWLISFPICFPLTFFLAYKLYRHNLISMLIQLSYDFALILLFIIFYILNKVPEGDIIGIILLILLYPLDFEVNNITYSFIIPPAYMILINTSLISLIVPTIIVSYNMLSHDISRFFEGKHKTLRYYLTCIVIDRELAKKYNTLFIPLEESEDKALCTITLPYIFLVFLGMLTYFILGSPLSRLLA